MKRTFNDLRIGQDVHMSGMTGPITKMSGYKTVNNGGTVGVFCTTEYKGVKQIVIGSPTDKISIAKAANGYFVVVINDLVRAVFLLSPYGIGSPACFTTSGYPGLTVINDTTEFVNADEVLHAVSLHKMSKIIMEDTYDEILINVLENYITMLEKGGYNDAGGDAVTDKLKELNAMLTNYYKTL